MPRDIALTPSDVDFLPYDLDRSGTLSVSEMARVNDADIATLLEERMASGSLNLPQTAEWLSSLSPSKGARVLSFMDDRRSPILFREIWNQDMVSSLRLLRFARESTGEPAVCQGREAIGWLRALAGEEHRNILWLLAVFDPAYAASVAAAFRPDAQALCTAAIDAIAETIDRPAPAPQSNRHPTRLSVVRERTTVVPMRAYAVADAGTREALLTADVSTCTALTLYDPIRRVGVMAHFDVNSDYQNSLDAIFADLAARGLSPRSFVARIVGGNASLTTSRRLTGDLSERLRLEGVSVLETERNGDGYAHAFVLDLRTGHLESYRGTYLSSDPTERDPHHPSQLGRTSPL